MEKSLKIGSVNLNFFLIYYICYSILARRSSRGELMFI